MQYKVALAILSAATAAFAAPLQARDDACADLEIIFARGTTEAQGLGIVGSPLVQNVQKLVSSTTSYAVVYPASEDFVNGPTTGATDAENRLKSRTSACPNMKFVLGGYSQGAMVVHDVKVSSDIQSKIVAIAVFGDPYRTLNEAFPIDDQSNVYADCATGDPVCENGSDVTAHLSYASDTQTAANFIAQRATGTSSSSGSSSSSAASATTSSAAAASTSTSSNPFSSLLSGFGGF